MLIVGAAEQVPGYAHGGVILGNDTKTKCWNGRVTERRRDSGWERARLGIGCRCGLGRAHVRPWQTAGAGAAWNQSRERLESNHGRGLMAGRKRGGTRRAQTRLARCGSGKRGPGWRGMQGTWGCRNRGCHRPKGEEEEP